MDHIPVTRIRSLEELYSSFKSGFEKYNHVIPHMDSKVKKELFDKIRSFMSDNDARKFYIHIESDENGIFTEINRGNVPCDVSLVATIRTLKHIVDWNCDHKTTKTFPNWPQIVNLVEELNRLVTQKKE